MAAKKRKTAKKKANLEDLQNFTTGRLEDDAIEKVKRLEDVLGIKQVNPFGTNDPNIFEDKLKYIAKNEVQLIGQDNVDYWSFQITSITNNN